MKTSLLAIFLLSLPFCTKAQPVHLTTVDQLHARLTKGKDTTYVINFWATWCAPCLKELPAFEALQQNFKADKLKVLLVSVDFRSKLTSAVIPLVRRNKMTTEVLLLNEKSQQEYIDRIDKGWTGAIPATLIVKDNRRQFYERDFTYAALLKEYQNFK